ncbi:MAG: fused MFS/spermidine synthase [Microlunatus sp.]|nr:fused MFS/spermidine synthase [Microlunatus sp.]MDN5770658.1 fused MFS/spermidine synthase [Microlunatus sp.]
MTLAGDPARRDGYLLRIGDTDQSYVDLEKPRRLEFDYVQRIADVIDEIAPDGERIRVVHVGGAGLTLPRYVTATRPRSPQIVLEPDAELTQFVRERLPLPRRSGIKIRAVDGRSGIAAMRDNFADLVILDAFVAARVPAELTTVEFLTDLRRVIGSAGVAVINVTDHGGLAYSKRVLAGMTRSFEHVVYGAEPATLKGRRFGNVIIVGSDTSLPEGGLVRRAAGSVFPYRLITGVQIRRFVGSARPFTDDEAEASPDPVAGGAHFG